jgi:hypothetical protein
MAELTSAGYQSLRDFLNSSTTTPPNWDYIEIYDDAQNPVTRVSITGDSRCQWLDSDGDKTLKVEFVVTGSDADIPLPTTLEYAAIWDDGSAGSQVTPKEQFATATINQDGDNVTITQSIDIPQ